MFVEPRFTHQEAQLLVELLEAEARELYPEIRHTDARAYRTELQQRLRTVERLAERLRPPVPAPEQTA